MEWRTVLFDRMEVVWGKSVLLAGWLLVRREDLMRKARCGEGGEGIVGDAKEEGGKGKVRLREMNGVED